MRRTVLRIVPMPAISTSTTSPSLRKRGGSKPTPTPSGVPVAITSPGDSVTLREIVSIRVGHVEDQVRGAAVLAQLAVDAAGDAQVGDVHLVGGDDPRAHRPEAVDALAEEPLLVDALQVARRHVVEDRVAEHVRHAPARAG